MAFDFDLPAKGKQPGEVRRDLEAARDRIKILIELLTRPAIERRWGLVEDCTRAADRLRTIIAANELPDDYKVAVIGRFKAGKSAFVNVMLGMSLAGENTSPETAAVTTFRAGNSVLAKIKLLDKGTWESLKEVQKNDPTDPGAQRVSNWQKFLGRDIRAPGAQQSEPIDLDSIEAEYVRSGGHTLEIPLRSTSSSESSRKAEAEFRREVGQFTSGSRPHHCFVESIDIETVSPLLNEGIILIDTPGLDDTERFRVQLTERAVQDVDAVLFLTKSGGAYGQSEKDFLISLLRKGRVKQLLFVVTQVDQTYEQHVDQARHQEEEPDPISMRIECEERRVRAEIEATIEELATDVGSSAGAKYIEEINSLEIAFISAKNHRDSTRGEPIKYPLRKGDPGGICEVKDTLFRLLSNESRLAAAKRAIQEGANATLADLLSIIENRKAVVRSLQNRDVAEQKLAAFRTGFEASGRRFADLVAQDCAVLKSMLEDREETGRLVAEIVAHQAEDVLGSYQMDDLARHWRTRRGGSWGYLGELQTRVANRIFPRVAQHLTKQTSDFSSFLEKFRSHLGQLSDEAALEIRRLDIEQELQLDIGTSLGGFLQETLGDLQQIVAGEETKIVSLLDTFVDESVEDKITGARERVASVLGVGTTVGQNFEVKAFYQEVRSILKSALETHVLKRLKRFAEHLSAKAKTLSDQSLAQVRAQIDRASTDIRAAAETALVGQRNAFERVAGEVVAEIAATREEISHLLAHGEVLSSLHEHRTERDDFEPRSKSEARPKASEIEISLSGYVAPKWESIKASAKLLAERMTLRNGDKGWPYDRLFPVSYLQGASEAWLLDPYLALRHQRRNLEEFVLHVIRITKLKVLHILTRETTKASADQDERYLIDQDKRYYDSISQSAFDNAGTVIQQKIEQEIHDRFFILDNGFIFKLGRGLDVYKPVAGLAHGDPSLRQVRACEVDVFGPE